jgi:hypothetical protein
MSLREQVLELSAEFLQSRHVFGEQIAASHEVRGGLAISTLVLGVA